MIYSALRPLIFKLDPEQAHELTIKALSLAGHLPIQHLKPGLWKPRKVMGLEFDNPIGVAAGLDKEGVAVDGLGAMGFGHVEVGTVTPRAQIGNPKPRRPPLPYSFACWQSWLGPACHWVATVPGPWLCLLHCCSA